MLDALIARADVLVENFRPGHACAAGPRLRTRSQQRFPRLVYASLSGYGQTGPRAAEPGYDAVLQGEGGLMSITGPADGSPYRLGVAVADIVTGMFAANGILLALYARQTTDRGQHVDVAMLDSVAALLTYQAGIVFATGRGAWPHGQPASVDRALRHVRREGRPDRAGRRQRRAVAAILSGRRSRGAGERRAIHDEREPRATL